MKMLKIIFKRSVWTVISLFFVILLVIAVVAEGAVKPYERWIDRYFGVRRTFLVDDEPEEGAEPVDTNYYPTKFSQDLDGSYKMHKENYDVTRRVNEEGMVLLWNKNNALPVNPATEKNVSTFGIMGLSHKDGKGTWVDNWAYHPTGSANVDLRNQTDETHDGVSILPNVEGYPELNVGPRLQMSLEKHKFNVNPKVIESTWVNGDQSQMNGYEKRKFTKTEVTWDKLQNDTANDPIGATTSQYNDLVLYTVGRWTGEGQTVGGTWKNTTNLLVLSEEEKSVLKGLSDLKNAGQIKKLVVLIAFSNPMDMNDFKDYNIDAALWVGNGGNTSTDSIVNVLVGNANPSGKLPDTWAYKADSAPATVNDGWYSTYEDPDKLIYNDFQENIDAYLVYQEGIYVGYRYYETRYEDLVLGQGNANSSKGVIAGSGNWNYGKEVAYPFGYGMSYTTFEYSDYKVEHRDGKYEISLKVKNTGGKAGKESVQIYLQKPYTEFDKTNKIEKSSVELVGYAKTGLLQPDASETVKISVSEYEFKTYDANVNKTYILEAGDYYLAAGANAHDAVNNILAAKGKTKADGMDAEGNGAMVYKTHVSRTENYANPYGETVTNQFDDIDINKFDGQTNKVTYLSRNDWNGTYPTLVELKATAKIAAGLSNEKPAEKNSSDTLPKMGDGKAESYKLKLIQLKGVPFEDPLWDDLLDTLTYEDMLGLLRGSMIEIEGIAAPEGNVYDGPLGLRDSYNSEVGARCALPCAPILAATFNDELIAEMTDSFGELSLQDDRDGLWGVSTNIHRTPYNGRNNEYYSEDGFLSGKVCAVQVKTLNKHGQIVYTKHFALNNNEMVRAGGNTWANEQSVREIYLKAFEASITEAKGNGIMTSYNRIGTTWTGAHKGLLTGVLRNEWSFKGVACTDYCADAFAYAGNASHPNVVVNAVIAGQDEWIAGLYPEAALKTDEYKTNATFCNALRKSAHRNLYSRIYTSAMNGVSSTTRVVVIIPEWQQTITSLKIAAAVLTSVCLALTVAGWVVWFIDRKVNGKSTI